MEIVKTREKHINDVEIGECFLFRDNLHMKISKGSLESKIINTYENIVINLENNKLNSINGACDIYVVPVLAKIII